MAEQGATSDEARPAEDSFGELFGRLIDDARTLIQAELELYRAIIFRRLVGSRPVVILSIAGTLLVVGSAIAMPMGLILTLAPLIGPLGATALIGLGGMAIGALLLRAAMFRFRKMAKIADDIAGKTAP